LSKKVRRDRAKAIMLELKQEVISKKIPGKAETISSLFVRIRTTII
jgi:hypothetical protein